MYVRSPFPPMPAVPATNYHNVLFRGPEQLSIPDHVMHVDAVTGQKRTRSEFIERLYDGATALGAGRNAGCLGLSSSDMIGIMSDNCLDFIVLVHSLLAITTPFALFSTYATPREMAYSLGKSKATHVFVQASILARFLPVAREVGFPEDHIYILEGADPTGLCLQSFGQMIRRVRDDEVPREPVRQAERNTLAYLIFSSGTSGLPKAVMASHGNLVYSIFQGMVYTRESLKLKQRVQPPTATPVYLGHLPMFHSFGLHHLCLRPPIRQVTIVVLPRWDLKAALSAIPKFRISVFLATPSIIHQLVSTDESQKTDLSSVEIIGSGAAYLPPKLSEKLASMLPGKAVLSEGYGLSEATVGLMGRPEKGLMDGRVDHVPTATGILLPGLEAMILRPDGTHCLPMEPGELYVKGGNITPGYWNDPDATKEAFIADGWLRTGDRFKANTRGTFWFEDRAKDTLKVSGLQVSPAEIENVLLDEPGRLVGDVAVAGVQTRGARTSDDKSPRAWVVLTAEGRLLGEREARERLERWVRANLSSYKWLRGGIQFVQEIPKNATGKILRRVLQEQYETELALAKL